MTTTAATVLRDARRRARLSQTDVARRSGVAQSVISAYETGRREPSVPMLARLVESTGHELVLELLKSEAEPLGLPDTALGRRVRRHRTAIVRTARRHGARNVRAFGSVARGDDTALSDVDLLVDLGRGVTLVQMIGLERELQDLLGVHVDVVPADSLKPRMRSRVLAEAIPL